jgi:hypothetical protein
LRTLDASGMIHAMRLYALMALLLLARGAAGQSAYYNLDSGRPTRVEDASPTPLRELELQFLLLRLEWLGDGTQRQRYEPKLSYGLLPMTELEMRFPIVRSTSPRSRETIGLASAAIGALHAFNVETQWPALAVAGEAVLPVGSLSASTPTYSLKALMTKTLSIGRIELNAGGGTWSIRVPRPGPVVVPNQCGDPGQPVCIPPDVACSVAPSVIGAPTSLACAPSATATIVTQVAGGQRSSGPHWTASLGVDHTFPLVSTLIAASVTVDRFDGLYPLNDWTAEVGFRKQLTPLLVADVGIGRRFAGTTQSTSLVAGVSYSTPFQW